MAGMANLIVNMIARTEQFQANMKRAASTIGTFNRSIAGIRSTLGSFGVALSAAGIGYFISRQLEAVDTALEFADSMDVGIEKLRRLEYAAAQSGLSVDLLRLTLAKMSVNIETAFEKGKTLAGLDPSKLMAMDTIDAFMALREAIMKIPNAYARAAAAVEIFGRGGRQFLGFLGKTNEEFQANYESAEEFYTITDEMAGKMEEANNQLKQMQLNLSGVSTKLIGELTPAIKGLLFLLTKSGEGWAVLLKELRETLEYRTGFGWMSPYGGNFAMAQAGELSGALEGFYGYGPDVQKEEEKQDYIAAKKRDIEYAAKNKAQEKEMAANQAMADSLYRKAMSPSEILKDQMDKIDKLLGMEYEGMVNLPDDFAEKARKQALADYEKTKNNKWQDQKFQEIRPDLINVAALSGRIDPMLTEAQRQTRLLQEIKIGITAGGLN